MRYRATVAYDGSSYFGFQRQIGDTPTVQLALEIAIARVTGQRVNVLAAGRTDTGVHATGQVIAFDVEWSKADEALLKALNANLPDDIALQDMRQQAGFHPRFDAISRTYRYRLLQTEHRQPLLRLQTWQQRSQLDETVMQQAAQIVIGEHDFASFGKPPQGENTVRHIFVSQWEQQGLAGGTLWTYTVEGNAFLQHMVRRLVGAMVKLGRGGLTLTEFDSLFRRAELMESMTMAPPQGLTLEAVRYSE